MTSSEGSAGENDALARPACDETTAEWPWPMGSEWARRPPWRPTSTTSTDLSRTYASEPIDRATPSRLSLGNARSPSSTCWSEAPAGCPAPASGASRIWAETLRSVSFVGATEPRTARKIGSARASGAGRASGLALGAGWASGPVWGRVPAGVGCRPIGDGLGIAGLSGRLGPRGTARGVRRQHVGRLGFGGLGEGRFVRGSATRQDDRELGPEASGGCRQRREVRQVASLVTGRSAVRAQQDGGRPGGENQTAQGDRILLVGTPADDEPAGSQGRLFEPLPLPARARQDGDAALGSCAGRQARPGGREHGDLGTFIAGHLGQQLRIGQLDLAKQPGEHRIDVDDRGRGGMGNQAPSAANVPQEGC